MINIIGFFRNRSGAFAVNMAVLAAPLLIAVGLGVDLTRKINAAAEIQNSVDSAALSLVQAIELDDEDLQDSAKAAFLANSAIGRAMSNLSVTAVRVTPTRLRMTVDGDMQSIFMKVGGYPRMDIHSVAEAETAGANGSPCITVLSSAPQAVLFNSGASMDAPSCEMHVHSAANPAFIHNAGVDLDLDKFCVKGTKYINNGSAMPALETGCEVQDDPYAGKLSEPSVSANCETSGWYDGSNFSFNPGVHCDTGVHGNAKITFKPGLHIIKGRMILDAGATVVAEGVTFYFPDTDSEIRVNGGFTFLAKAPESGAYKGILMFEKTSNAANNANKRQYIFNGSIDEQIEGVIYLPNRDVVYNSTTNVGASKINMVVNTMIVNSANWKFSGYGEAAGGGGSTAVRLVR